MSMDQKLALDERLCKVQIASNYRVPTGHFVRFCLCSWCNVFLAWLLNSCNIEPPAGGTASKSFNKTLKMIKRCTLCFIIEQEQQQLSYTLFHPLCCAWCFVKHFLNVPPAIWPILQLRCSPTGNRNFWQITKHHDWGYRTQHSVEPLLWKQPSKLSIFLHFLRGSGHPLKSFYCFCNLQRGFSSVWCHLHMFTIPS